MGQQTTATTRDRPGLLGGGNYTAGSRSALQAEVVSTRTLGTAWYARCRRSGPGANRRPSRPLFSNPSTWSPARSSQAREGRLGDAPEADHERRLAHLPNRIVPDA